MNGGQVAWKSKLTPTVESSSTHAELAALASCVEDVCNLCNILKTLGFEQKEPAPIYVDTELCIAICNNKLSTHNKPVNVRYQKVRERVRLMEIILVPCLTLDQRTDILTKALGNNKYHECSSHIICNDERFTLSTVRRAVQRALVVLSVEAQPPNCPAARGGVKDPKSVPNLKLHRYCIVTEQGMPLGECSTRWGLY
eukprot:1919090-Rhodomonas_salina.1